MTFTRRTALAAGAAAAFGAPAQATGDIVGHWAGTWSKAGDDLPVSVQIGRDGQALTASFSSDGLQVVGIPFAEAAWTAPNLRLVLRGDATTTVFEGVLAGAVLTGTFEEAGTHGRFQLARIPPPPQTLTEAVTFRNGEVALSGTLVLPAGRGPHPAIIFLHGSGAEGRWAARYLAQRFAQAGIAGLVYDKRGVGRSTGDWRDAGFDDLIADAAAGVALLRARPDIDGARVGGYGHSQGGTILPLLAARAGLAFVIASAASGVSPAATELYSIGNSLGVSRMGPDEAGEAQAFARAIVAVGYEGADRAGLEAIAARVRGRPWFFEPPPPEHHYWRFSRRTAAFDPAAAWAPVRAPVLLLYGETDQRVPPAASSQAVLAILARGGADDVRLRLFPGADHSFRLPTPSGGWPKRAAGYADALVAWTRVRTGLDPRLAADKGRLTGN
jgi:alpha-beta hydrolase superfamily lysophospholipase